VELPLSGVEVQCASPTTLVLWLTPEAPALEVELEGEAALATWALGIISSRSDASGVGVRPRVPPGLMA
jgi:hypothetical protein